MTNLSSFTPTARYNDFIKIARPDVGFHINNGGDESEAQVSFDELYKDMVLIYFPAFFDAADATLDEDSISSAVNCQVILSTSILITGLIESTVYTFCAIFRTGSIETPFQCKSYQSQTPFRRTVWIYQEQKVIFLTSFLMLCLFALLIGIVMTYFLIRRIPTLMRGKRIVRVKNRSKDVVIMPGSSRNNSSSSYQRESDTPIKMEHPAYLTPLPRQAATDNGCVLCCCSFLTFETQLMMI